MFPVFEVKQRPHIGASAQDNVATPAAITTIRTAHRGKFFPAEMARAGSTLSGAATDFYVVNKIGFGQGFSVSNFKYRDNIFPQHIVCATELCL